MGMLKHNDSEGDLILQGCMLYNWLVRDLHKTAPAKGAQNQVRLHIRHVHIRVLSLIDLFCSLMLTYISTFTL